MSTPEKPYTVVAQPIITDLDTVTGNPTKGRLISFRDNLSGHTGEVFLPLDVYTVENARDAIEHQLAIMRGVAALPGD